ncbi:MAG: helix-turn-helix domain-containing protein [Campylobacter sp.]|nr:helix-turn-helix domain-containing protein [Campylobacter sp.]
MATIKFREVLNEELKNPEFKKAYEALDDEFETIKMLVKARNEAKLTQAQVAEKMGVKQSAVARIESGVLDIKYSTLLSYIKAVGKKLVLA